MRHYVLGNGPSLTYDFLKHWEPDGKTWAVNRIWKQWTEPTGFADLEWRPDFYVRCEVPEYDPDHVVEDLAAMGSSGSHVYIQAGFLGLVNQGRVLSKFTHSRTKVDEFVTCDGKQSHDWHLRPDIKSLMLLPKVCGYGTAVHVAAQLAVAVEGATELVFLGCDLGRDHFYYDEPDEKFINEKLAWKAHEILARCCTVPVYDGGTGALTMYGRLNV